MGMFGKIKKVLGFTDKSEGPKPFRRWSAFELERTKAYLENKQPEEWTAEDHYLSVEYVLQQYLPEDDDTTAEQWSKIMADMRGKIDINMVKAAAGELGRTAYQPPPRYDLTKDDFLRDIVPTFSSFAWLPFSHSKSWQGREVWESLYEFTQPYSSKHGEAKDALIGICDVDAAQHVVGDLVRTYSQIRQAQLDGSTRMQVKSLRWHCDHCMSLVGRKLGVDELLASYKKGDPIFPHALEYEDQVRWCPAPFLNPETPMKEGDDPEFHAFFVDLFDGPEHPSDKLN